MYTIIEFKCPNCGHHPVEYQVSNLGVYKLSPDNVPSHIGKKLEDQSTYCDKCNANIKFITKPLDSVKVIPYV